MGPSVQQTIITGFLGEKGDPLYEWPYLQGGTLCMGDLHAITSLLATDLIIPLQ